MSERESSSDPVRPPASSESEPVHPPQSSSSAAPRSGSSRRGASQQQPVEGTSSSHNEAHAPPQHRSSQGHTGEGQSNRADLRTRGFNGDVHIRSEADRPSGDGISEGADRMVIWGTSINRASTKTKIERFFANFGAEEEGTPKYSDFIDAGVESGQIVLDLNVDAADVLNYDDDLYHDLVHYPVEIITIMDEVVNSTLQDRLEEPDANRVAQCRVYNLNEVKTLRELGPRDIDTLVSLRGMVIRASNNIPDMYEAFFQCVNCKTGEKVKLNRGKIAEPTVCAGCQAGQMMNLIHNRCFFKDKQNIRMQEAPDKVPDGETPQTVNLVAHEDLVDTARPGDRMEVTGIYRAAPLRVKPTARSLKAVFKTYIDVIHFRRYRGKLGEVGEPGEEVEEVDMSEEAKLVKEAKMREIAASPDVYERLLKSFAPGIYEYDDVKMGILCQLFGGANIASDENSNVGRTRGEINCLLIGDPGVAKSQLLQYVHKIAPRGIYTSGKGSSAVGLTAYVAKDPETREMVLESGALVLSDQGICCIDEFDKMSDATRSILHEVMEQQTISVAKAGIVCTLNARTSILAAANPVHSRYNPTLSVVDNLNLPPSLLSRFDLIYLLLDKPNPVNDRRLARHLVSLFFHEDERTTRAQEEGVLDLKTFTDYVAFVRAQPPPELSEEAARDLAKGYVGLRRASANPKTITATPRQLESIIRLSEARAKMRLSPTVDAEDVAEGIRLMKVATQSAATDPRTGLIDMEIISTGRSSSARQRARDLAKRIADHVAGQRQPNFRIAELLELFNQDVENDADLVTFVEMREAVDMLLQDDKVIKSGGEGRDIVFQRIAV